MTRNIIKPIIFSLFFAASASFPFLAIGDEIKLEPAKPQGRNCQLLAPPIDSGEEGGHGVLIQVSPRIKDIDSNYSGCQAVFWTTAKEPARLAWLVEVVDGDPVRQWFPDPPVREVSKCVYKHGALMQGAPDVCPAPHELLMPSQPAGCEQGTSKGEQCQYDRD